jgi:hypothetical protein
MTSALFVSLFFASQAQAQAANGPDLRVRIDEPVGYEVYETQPFSVVVSNNGNRDASTVRLTVQLPVTNTSPQVYVMGEVGLIDSRCQEVGTTLVCTLGTLRKGRSTTVGFDIALPWKDGTLDFSAAVTTTSNEPVRTNNSDAAVGTVSYIDTPIVGPRIANNSHCTGQGLTGYFECTLFPSSLSGHTIQLNADGTIDFVPAYPGFTGLWGQTADNQLWFDYYELGDLVASFSGNGVGADCFEGLTVFPGSAYMSAYEVCLD